MISASSETWQAFGLAVMLALVEASPEEIVQSVVEVSAEDLWMAEGRTARFGFPLACGRLPVAVRGLVCLCPLQEVRRYHDEFLNLPGAL